MLESRDEGKESTSGCGEEGAEGCVCRGNTRSFCRVMGGKRVETRVRLWEGTDEAGPDLFRSSGVCVLCVCV